MLRRTSPSRSARPTVAPPAMMLCRQTMFPYDRRLAGVGPAAVRTARQRQEAFAGGRSLLEAQGGAVSPLAKAVADDITVPEVRTAARDRLQAQFKGAQLGEIKSRAVEELRGVAALVDAKAPQDAAGFKAWLLDVAKKAAEAGTEGGFLGFGGVAVSEAEKATLQEIAAALGTSRSVQA